MRAVGEPVPHSPRLPVGDEAFQRRCYARIEEMKADGVTLLFVSHSSAAVLELFPDLKTMLKQLQGRGHGVWGRIIIEYLPIVARYLMSITIAPPKTLILEKGIGIYSITPNQFSYVINYLRQTN